MFKKAFTLAEVLITLTIIGIVASLTMPGVINNYQSKVSVAQLQKVYNLVENAVAQAMLDDEEDLFSNTSYYSDSFSFLAKYFKTSVICATSSESTNMDNCMASKYKSPDKTVEFSSTWMLTGELLSEGEVNLQGIVCAALDTGATICKKNGQFIVDVNGVASPNTIGRDLFWFGMVDPSSNENYFGPYSSKMHPSDDDYGALLWAARGEYCRGNITGVRESACMQSIITNGWKMRN